MCKTEVQAARKSRLLMQVFCFISLAILLSATLGAQTTILHVFRGSADGAIPEAGLVRDSSGNLYGTTSQGGGKGCRPRGCGTVFEVTPGGRQKILYAFSGGPDGRYPFAVVLDPSGNLYGTTSKGGQNNFGTVFKLDTQGNKTILHDFTGGDGSNPLSGLLRDPSGNLYGTTHTGGSQGLGTVFKIDAAGQFTVLYSFSGPPDGAYGSQAALIRDAQGNLFGTTVYGGDANCFNGTGCGTVFRLDTSNRETVLHRFSSTDGQFPGSPLVRDGAGNLYGMTTSGSDLSCVQNCGVIFKLDPSGQETILHSFTFLEGHEPYGPFARDSAGNLFGAAIGGGDPCTVYNGCGTVFKLDATGSLTVLQTFHDGLNGAVPYGGVLLDAAGNLFGTTAAGGSTNCDSPTGCGVVFEITPAH